MAYAPRCGGVHSKQPTLSLTNHRSTLQEMDSRELALRCRDLAEGKKAENLVVLDMRKLSSVTDYFVIATGTSEPHLRALIEELTERIAAEFAIQPRAVDGALKANWVVLDYLDVIVHLMRAETRERYGLEILWGDAPRVRRRTRKVTPRPLAKRTSRSA